MNTATPVVRWQVFADAMALAGQAAALVFDNARAAISARGVFHLVLAGGQTPKDAYDHLRECGANWVKWQIYFGDERCLPRGDPGRNDTMVRRAWLDHIRIPPVNVHPIPAEYGAEKGAQRYAEVMRRVPEFDLVLLGLGEDGHTASLFPGGAGLENAAADAVAVNEAPKPPPARVSLSATRLSRAHRVLFLVSGESKREAVRAWRAGADIPARHIAPPAGVDVYVDRAAWSEA